MKVELPEYTDGVLDLYVIETDEKSDFPVEKIRNLKQRIWYREISVFDKTRYELNQANIDVTLKVRIPSFKNITSKNICIIENEQHKIYNATTVVNKNGFKETEITLKKPEKKYEVMS